VSIPDYEYEYDRHLRPKVVNGYAWGNVASGNVMFASAALAERGDYYARLSVAGQQTLPVGQQLW